MGTWRQVSGKTIKRIKLDTEELTNSAMTIINYVNSHNDHDVMATSLYGTLIETIGNLKCQSRGVFWGHFLQF